MINIKTRYSISEISKLSNISTYTLRYYDKIGLCKPAYRDESNKYRYYSQEQVSKLYMIERFKSLNFSYDEIKALNEASNVQSLEKTFEKKQKHIQNKIEKLTNINREYDKLLSVIKASKKRTKELIVNFTYIPLRKCYFLSMNFPVNSLNDCIKIISFSVLPIFNAAKSQSFDTQYTKRQLFLKINENNLMSNMFNTYNGIGYILPEKLNCNEKLITEIPCGLYAICQHVGRYETLHITYKKIIKYLSTNNYIISGDSIEIALIGATMTNNPNEFITEIQIPVNRIR